LVHKILLVEDVTHYARKKLLFRKRKELFV
jgi:hypothetical protein